MSLVASTLFDQGLMIMLGKECKVLAEVRRSPKRLYILNIEQSDPVCLLSETSEVSGYMDKPATDHSAAVKHILR